MSQFFGQSIPVTGLNNGFPGNVSRVDGAMAIVARQVLSTTTNPLKFGDGAVVVPDATGGTYQSLIDFLATATNAANLQKQFAGVAVRNVSPTLSTYTLQQQPQVTVKTTTATQSVVGSTTVVVADASNITIGNSVEAAGIQANTLVTGVASTTITISLPTIAAMSATSISFTAGSASLVGSFQQGDIGECLLRGSIVTGVLAAGGTPESDLPIYIRTVANAGVAGSFVGGFEAADDLSTSSVTIGITLGSTTVTTSSGTGVAAGQRIVGPGIPSNTYVVSGSSTTWVISNAALSTIASGGAASFYNTALLGTPDSPWLVFRTGVIDPNNVAEIVLKERRSA